MSEVRIRWTVADKVLLDRAFTRLAIDISDFTPALRAAEIIIEQQTRRQFAQQGAPSWQALSSHYARRKARRYPGKTILRRTDALYHSLATSGAVGAVREITPTQLRYGTDLQVNDWNLGLIHQRGRRDGKLPARPMLRLGAAAKTLIVDAFRGFFMRCAASRGMHP